MSVSKERRDEFSKLSGEYKIVRLELFDDDAHFELLWRCVRDGDLNDGGFAWGYTTPSKGTHDFDLTTKNGWPRITYKIDDLKKCKTRQDLIDLTNVTVIQAKIAGDGE
jgi:hypothetical protein